MQTKHEFLRRISAIIAVFFTLAFTGCGQTPESPGSLPVSGVVSETTAQSGQETAGVSESGSFTIHFIDVGQADSALVTCDGHSMQLISVTYPSLHRVCECSIIEDGVDLWARRTLDSMTAGTVEDLVETVLYVARMYERSKCFERIFVNCIQMEESEYDALIRHLNDPDSIDDEYQISDVVFAADNTIASVLWKGNSKDGVSGMVTLAMNGKTVYKTKNTKAFCNHWILPYNGAEYHVLVDVLPKKTVLEETIYVNKPYAERIKKYLRGAEVQGDGSSLSKTAKFSDGFEMDIRCCGGKDDSWTEAILYDNTGKEVVATEPCDGFTGCWELKDEDTNTVYRAHVMTKSNLN